MSGKYEKIYQQQRHALGTPFDTFIDFFDNYDVQQADVLDLGCGQGRDALFIARQGHHVVGVDISPTGIAQLLEDAEKENLNIEGVVADLSDYEPDADYDVIVIDRTLHMLAVDVRMNVLAQVSRATRHKGYVLIADEKSNMPVIRAFFQEDETDWTIRQDKKNFLVIQKG